MLATVAVTAAFPAAASALTISGTATHDEQAGGAWALCDGTTPNVSLVIDGGARISVPCTRATGAFSFTTTLTAANQTLAVFMDPATASAKAVAYTHNADTIANIAGLELIHDRVILRSESAAPVTGAQMELFDATHDTDVPVDVTGGSVNVNADVGVRVDAGDTWQPGRFVNATHLHLRGVMNSSGFELNGSGRGACGFGPGASRPLCISAGGSLTGIGDARFYFARDVVIEAITYPGTVITGSATGAVAHLGTAPGQTLTSPTNIYIGWYGANQRVIVDTTLMQPNIVAGQRLFFLQQSVMRGYGGGTVTTNGSLFGGGRIDMPETDLVVRALQSYTAFGSSWFNDDGTVTFRNVRFENNYTRNTWGGAPAWNGMTPAYNSGGAQSDTPAAMDEFAGTIVVAGTQSTNGTDWQLAKFNNTGSPDGAFGAAGKVTWNSGGAQADAALGIDGDGTTNWVVGYQGTNGRDWAIRRYNSTTGLPDATFGGTGTVTFNSGLGSNLDEARSVRVVNGQLWVAGVVGTAANGLDWMVRRYQLDGTFIAAVSATITAGDDQVNWMEWDNNYLWLGGSAAVNGGDWAIRKIDVWGGGGWGSLPGGTADTILYGPTAGADASTAASYVNTEIFSAYLVVGGTQATNGGDWVLRAFHPNGYAVDSFASIPWNSGGANNDSLRAINVKHESVTAMGDNGSDMVLRRYDSDGESDTSWGSGGQITWDSGTGFDTARAASNDYWGDMFVAGTQASNGNDLVVRRYNYAGQLADTNGPGATRIVGMAGADNVHLTGDVLVGAATDAGTTMLDLNANDRSWEIDGDLTVTSQGSLRASDSSPLELGGNLTATGSFLASGGTVVLDDASRPSLLSGGANLALANLRVARADKQVQVATTTQLDVSGQLTVDGGSCASPARISSNVPGTRARINATGAAALSFVRFQDIQAVTPLSPTNATDAGNNLGIAFASTCAPLLAAPTGMFVGDTSAVAGARHPRITATNPRFSWLAPAGTTFTGQRTQVLSTPPVDAAALWRLDGAGTDFGTGAASNLTLGTAPQDPAFVASQTRFGQALDFDGDDRASSTAAPKLDLSSLSVDLWMQAPLLPAASSGTAVLARRDGTFALKARNDGLIYAQVRVAGAWQETWWPGAALFDGGWHHLAMTAGSPNNRITLYVDGVRVEEGNYSGAIDRPTAPVWVGDDGTGTAYFRGRLDDIRISPFQLDEGEVRGLFKARQPHATVLWDSSPGGAGVALASCAGPARCADITYGGSSTDLLIDGARYHARVMYRDAGTTWTPWSDTDWFDTSHGMSITLPGGVVNAMGTAVPGTDQVGQTDLQVTSNAAHGYSIVATTTTDTWGMSSGVDTIPRFNNPTPDTPAPWAVNAPLGFGVTVLTAPSRSSARWGTGTAASDIGLLNYAGVSRSSPVTLTSTTSGTGVAELTRIGLRTNAPPAIRPGAYSTTISLTVVPNP